MSTLDFGSVLGDDFKTQIAHEKILTLPLNGANNKQFYSEFLDITENELAGNVRNATSIDTTMDHKFLAASSIQDPFAGAVSMAFNDDGWPTYNFEVEDYHTYIAGGLKVHNTSLLELIPEDALDVRVFDTDQDGRLDTASYARRGGINEIIYGKDTNGDGNTDLVTRTTNVPQEGHLGPGDKIIWQQKFDGNSTTPRESKVVEINYAPGSLQGEEVGRTLGSALGHAIGSNNIFAQVAGATITATLMQNIGELLHKSIDLSLLGANGIQLNPIDVAIRDTFHDLGRDLTQNAQIQIQNGISSILVGEIANALHLNGWERGIFTTTGNTITNQVLSNVAEIIANPVPPTQINASTSLLKGFDSAALLQNLGNSLGGYFGSQLGSIAVNPHNQQAALFGSASAAVGSYIGATALSFVPVIGTLIGAFAGQAFGNLVGNAMFDDDRISRYTLFTDGNGQVQYGYPYTQDGASLALSQYIAKTAADSINSVFGSMDARIDVNASFNPFTVGWYVDTHNVKLMYAVNQQYQTNYNPYEAQGIVSAAVNYAIQNSELGGNDVVLRRAYHVSHNAGLAQLGFDLQVAKDFKKYVGHTALINSLIAENPSSEFAAGWIATLQRAKELGLHKASDFNYMEYTAGNIDLQNHFGRDANALISHFINFGIDEGRGQFDSIQYLAANPGLAQALGSTDRTIAAQHYLDFGKNEGRPTQFDYLQYLASNIDVAIAYGSNNPRGAELHYVNFGVFEGRQIKFDYLQYLAANPDLAPGLGGINKLTAQKHYIDYGIKEGRVTTFEAQRYIASYGDLIRAFGTDKTAATKHFIEFGGAEGRKITFDPVAYRDHNPDVAAAFGNDLAAVVLHYIKFGYYEGRDNGSGHPLASPVILDLTGNGLDITLNDYNSIKFDMMGTGEQLPTAWAGPQSGILVIDLNAQGNAGADGVITHQHELDFWAAFTNGQPYDPSGVPSDMLALRLLYDTNHNGQLDAGDTRWSEFRVWKDGNQNGVSDAGELQTLADRHITAIDLTPSGPSTKLSDGSVIRGTTTYTLDDGTLRVAADVQLAYGRSFDKNNPVSLMKTSDKEGYHLQTALEADGQMHAKIDFSNETNGHVIDLNDQSFIQGLKLSDAPALSDVIGSNGDDTIIASSNSQITGGPGSDVFDLARASGKIVITDFVSGEDIIYFGIDRIKDIADFKSRAVQVDNDVRVQLAEDTYVIIEHAKLDYLNIGTLLVT